MSEGMRRLLDKVLVWVESFEWYSQFELPKFRQHKQSLSESDVAALTEAGKFVSAPPLCSVKAFCVPEWDKNRKRPIFWPDINASIDKSFLNQGLLPLRAAVRSTVSETCFAVQFDGASWYDQLGLCGDIPRLFSVFSDQCLGSLPMGFRPSADIAHVVMSAIADFPLPEGVKVTVYIDNIRFGGPSRSAVESAARQFVERAASVGAVLNSDAIDAVEEEDFLGERYDLRKQTRALTEKTMKKLSFARSLLSKRISFRQLASVYGLLFFASEVLDTNLSVFFKALRFYRTASSCVQDWDKPAPPIPNDAKTELLAWFSSVEENKPVPTSPSGPESHDATIYCDASEFGWGAYVVTSKGTSFLSGSWTDEDREIYALGHSTVAEPLAIQRIVAASVDCTMKAVKVFSDHQGLVFAGNRGYGKCESYNNMCRFLSRYNTVFTFGHIPGSKNTIADRLSREGMLKFSEEDLDLFRNNLL